MAENVKVVVRCRPMNHKENEQKSKNIIEIQDGIVSLEHPTDKQAPKKIFTFDNAYNGIAPTEALYNDICYSLVENVLEGYNGTIFAYGQTGCGKSHTMQGPSNNEIHQQLTTTTQNHTNTMKSQRGIISRSFDHIFEAISVANTTRYLALVSYLEIYNENIRDLLNPSSNNGPNTTNQNLQLKEIPGDGIYVQNLSTHTVHNAQECEELLQLGSKNRIIGSTLMNTNSSRSHSIFTISLEQIDTNLTRNTDTETETETNGGIKKSKLNLVDLAGSERQNKTGATGERFKEATKINLSLSALGNVISALVDSKTKHIPYRDSKLTRLLQDSLGGNTKTLMIACISPSNYNYDETLSTLRYANRTKNIHNKPIINEDPKDTMLRQYQNEILQLKQLLQSNHHNLDNNNNNLENLETLENLENLDQQKLWLNLEREKLKNEYELETEKLKYQHNIQENEKNELVQNMEQLKLHYEKQLKELTSTINSTNHQNSMDNNKKELNNNIMNRTEIPIPIPIPIIQQEALNRIEIIKNALIGGERSNDIQLKEKRYKKKLAAQRRLSALAHALNRMEQSSDRDLLQTHCTDIQQELKYKNETIKTIRSKVHGLEREISDLQSEFQLDRADYLETIRKLQRNLKFYQQIFEKTLPILRKDGKYWDPIEIQSESIWNDDNQKWKLPEDSMNRLKLPPAASAPSATKRLVIKSSESDNQDDDYENDNIAENYFRPKRNAAAEIIQQRKGFKNWRDLTMKNMKNIQKSIIGGNGGNGGNGGMVNLNTNWINLSTTSLNKNNNSNSNSNNNVNSLLASWLPQNHTPINKTWCGGGNSGGGLSSATVSSTLRTSAATNNNNNNNHHHHHQQQYNNNNILPPPGVILSSPALQSQHQQQQEQQQHHQINYQMPQDLFSGTTTASDVH